MTHHSKRYTPDPVSHPRRAVTLAFSNGWSEQLNEIALLLELPWVTAQNKLTLTLSLHTQEPLRAKTAVGDEWQLVSQSTNSWWKTGSVCDSTEVVGKPSCPTQLGSEPPDWKRITDVHLKSPTTNPKHNFTAQIHASEYLENKNIFLPALTECLEDRHRERSTYF